MIRNTAGILRNFFHGIPYVRNSVRIRNSAKNTEFRILVEYRGTRNSVFLRNFVLYRNSVFLQNPNLFDRQLPLLCQPNDMTPSDREHVNIRNSEFFRNSAEYGNPNFYGIPRNTEFHIAEFRIPSIRLSELKLIGSTPIFST